MSWGPEPSVTVRPCDAGGYIARIECGMYYASASGATEDEARANVTEVWNEKIGTIGRALG